MTRKNTADAARESGRAALKLVGIVKTYGEGENAVCALKGVNIAFRKNEFVSVLGPSGCGKTTMLNIIGGLDRYTSGDLIINGVSTKEYKDRDWDTYRNNSIGFVFQSYNLIPHQTVLSNVELALTLSGVSKAERHARAKKVLEQVGLTDQAHKKPNQLSGGQMQRVAIARALVNDPEIILADEPTGALDTETSVQILDLLKEVARDRLVIMVTHNPKLAERYSTRIINLLDGEKTGDTNPFEENSGAEIPSVILGEEKPRKADANETAEEPAKNAAEEKGAVKAAKAKKETGKAAMKLTTAFSLSFSNLRTKKGRTTLTAIAGSIGIIGIALVLAVSTGFSGYIKRLQSDTLSTYPLTISEATIDLEDFQKLTNREITDEMLAQKLEQKVFTKAMFGDLTNMLKSNSLTDEYIKYVTDYADERNAKAQNAETKWAYCVQYGYGMDINDYIFTDIGYNLDNTDMKHSIMSVDTFVQVLEGLFDEGMNETGMNISSDFVRQYIPTMSELPDSSALIESQYELINGEWASEKDELMIVVDKYNRITDITLALLGYKEITGRDGFNATFGGENEYSFEDIKNKKFYYIDNSERYASTAETPYNYLNLQSGFVSKIYASDAAGVTPYTPAVPAGAMELKITGIIRLKENVQQGVLDAGLAYTSAFVRHVLEDTQRVNAAVNHSAETNSNKEVGVFSTMQIMQYVADYYKWTENGSPADGKPSQPVPKAYSLRKLAGDDTVNKILIYSAGYDEKEAMKLHLDKWNEQWDENDETEKLNIVHYSDSTAMLFSALNSIVDAVKIVLIAFTAISLVVSSIMIGIITYVSVVERTKEIGVLRSIGARKKDISRIFNAETFLIGLFAGLIGVAVSYLLTIPINLIIGEFIENAGAIAALKVTDALILVIVSFALTLIAGIIPARIAADKDPVVALRTE